MKKHNTKVILPNFIYDLKSLAAALRVHINTVRRWSKEGLPSIENSGLFLGSSIKQFLIEKSKKSRVRLAQDEFYCFKCRKGTLSKTSAIEFKVIGKLFSSQVAKVIIKGICKECGRNINRYASGDTIEKFKKIYKKDV